MEISVTAHLLEIQKNAPQELQPFFSLLLQAQRELNQLLTQALAVDISLAQYPEPNLTAIIADDNAWKTAGETLPPAERLCDALARVWSVEALLDKTAQFYRQSSQNHAHPTERLFFSSLAEIKQLLRRRASSLNQSLGNQVWSEVGFSPFILAREF
ncbi:MAG TPA: hypothetical protein VN611_10185 [Patescibacteria group bacterium]|nr:hypothetical protein [Patescibacteria group bacterium]